MADQMTDINYGAARDHFLKYMSDTAIGPEADAIRAAVQALQLAAAMENALGKYEQVELAVFSGWGDGETNYRATLSNTPMSGGETRTEQAASLAAAIEAATKPDNTPITE